MASYPGSGHCFSIPADLSGLEAELRSHYGRQMEIKMVLSTAYVARGVVILIYYIFDVICLLSYGHLMTEMNRLELCACVREEEAICLGVWCVCFRTV